jgi:hypothetical protein
MPRLLAPIETEFLITDVDGVSPDDPIVVSFKQATEALNLHRQEMLAKPVTRSWQDEAYQEQLSFTPFSKRMAIDVWLTLIACNIERDNGSPLFNFHEIEGAKKVTDKTLEKFLTKWGKLPPQWAEAIYERCLRVNPTWGFGGDNEDEDEDVLTPGEEDAGEPATE